MTVETEPTSHGNRDSIVGRSARIAGSDRSRRELLLGIGTTAAVGLAGCLGRGGGGALEEVSIEAPLAGDPDGAVTIQVFSDFACPHCRRYHLEVFPALESGVLAVGGARYEHYDFPIPVDPEWSWTAARAARAVQADAGDAAFWAFATKLYENQGRLTRARVARLADEVGADGRRVRQVLGNGGYRDVVAADRTLGEELGIPGTPGVLVDGRLVSPGRDSIEQAVTDAR